MMDASMLKTSCDILLATCYFLLLATCYLPLASMLKTCALYFILYTLYLPLASMLKTWRWTSESNHSLRLTRDS